MIIKRTRGVSAIAALGYDHGPGRFTQHHDPRRVAGSVGGANWQQRARAMQDKIRADGDAEKGTRGRVIRLAVAATPTDRILTDREWAQIAQRVVQEFTGAADAFMWEAVRHDPGHIHITLLQRDASGRLLSESFDFRRFARISEGIERDFGLQRVDHTPVRNRPERVAARTERRRAAAALHRGTRGAPRREHQREVERQELALAARDRTHDGRRERGRDGMER